MPSFLYRSMTWEFMVEENTEAVGYPVRVPSFFVLRVNFSIRKKSFPSCSRARVYNAL